jgi:hypothetical protein
MSPAPIPTIPGFVVSHDSPPENLIEHTSGHAGHPPSTGACEVCSITCTPSITIMVGRKIWFWRHRNGSLAAYCFATTAIDFTTRFGGNQCGTWQRSTVCPMSLSRRRAGSSVSPYRVEVTGIRKRPGSPCRSDRHCPQREFLNVSRIRQKQTDDDASTGKAYAHSRASSNFAADIYAENDGSAMMAEINAPTNEPA